MTHAPASEFCLMCGALTTDPNTADRAKIVSCSKAFASVLWSKMATWLILVEDVRPRKMLHCVVVLLNSGR